MTEKQKLSWSMGLSITAIILSVISLGVYIFKIDSCDIVGADTFIAVTAAFIGISVTRDRKGIIIPYIEYPIPFNCVENIVVGPAADFDRERESILIFLNSKGIEWDSNKIIKSKVPY